MTAAYRICRMEVGDDENRFVCIAGDSGFDLLFQSGKHFWRIAVGHIYIFRKCDKIVSADGFAERVGVFLSDKAAHFGIDVLRLALGAARHPVIVVSGAADVNGKRIEIFFQQFAVKFEGVKIGTVCQIACSRIFWSTSPPKRFLWPIARRMSSVRDTNT